MANTSGGAFIHFISNSNFHDELFATTDYQNVKIHYEIIGDKHYLYMVFSNDTNRQRYYFKPPDSLSYAAFIGLRDTLLEKDRLFRTIHISKNIKGISRNLTLHLDKTGWMKV